MHKPFSSAGCSNYGHQRIGCSDSYTDWSSPSFYLSCSIFIQIPSSPYRYGGSRDEAARLRPIYGGRATAAGSYATGPWRRAVSSFSSTCPTSWSASSLYLGRSTLASRSCSSVHLKRASPWALIRWDRQSGPRLPWRGPWNHLRWICSTSCSGSRAAASGTRLPRTRCRSWCRSTGCLPAAPVLWMTSCQCSSSSAWTGPWHCSSVSSNCPGHIFWPS